MLEHDRLPIDAIRDSLSAALDEGPVVVTSPTGSGKSTQVPRWCGREGRVLVVEPRRVACRSLAQRVAELEGCRLGDAVGYSVRDDRRAGDSTRVLFATPGIVLRMLVRDDVAEFGTVVVDELHERSLDVDLILALLLARFRGRLLAMSATLDGDRVAAHLGGRHIHAPGRVFPVEVHHVPGEELLPDVRGLEDRLVRALDLAAELPGDILTFLPGKGEIASCAKALRHAAGDLEVIELHGGLTLGEQGRAFEASRRRRVILATNVAETSITLPGVGVVIDSGLVRRARYHDGRGYLTLVPVALDSAEQRAGRAGRTAPGACFRLWSPAARLEAMTPPAVHRESLVPLVLAAAACGSRVEDLPFLDAPKEHAVDAAREDLHRLGTVDEAGAITDRGRRVFGLPLDPFPARLLIEAEAAGCLDDAIDLVAALGVDRPLFRSERPEQAEDDLRASGCDAVAAIRALREGQADRHRISDYALREARSIAKRLRGAWGLPGASAAPRGQVDRRRLARTALAADPRSAHVARRRKRKVAWSNGGTEIELGRESAVQPDEGVEAIIVLGSRGLGVGRRDTRIIATCAMPVPLSWLVESNLGRDRVAAAELKRTRLVAKVERVFAKRVIATRDEVPTGRLAREAIRDLYARGSLFREARDATLERLEAAALFHRLQVAGHPTAKLLPGPEPAEHRDLTDWVLHRLEELGLESGGDLALLSPEDLTAPDLPADARALIDREFPRTVSSGDATYAVTYDLAKREATLDRTRGQGRALPPLTFLPPFNGFRILVRHGNALRVLRER